MKTQPFMVAYRALFQDLNDNGISELNARTGVGIIMLEGGHSFKIDLATIPVAGNRRFWPYIAAAEIAWQFMGTRDPEWILSKAPKIWSNFIEDGQLKTAYGYRWRKHFNRDQIAMAVQQLRDNPTNRQLFISAWDPSIDGLGAPNQPKNIPCPIGFSVSVSKDQVHGSVFMRSSDVFVGLPYDVMGYALTIAAMAKSAGKTPGTLHMTLAHPHIYAPHLKFMQESLTQRHWIRSVIPLPDWSLEDINTDPDGYIDMVKKLTSNSPMHEWNPMPKVIL